MEKKGKKRKKGNEITVEMDKKKKVERKENVKGWNGGWREVKRRREGGKEGGKGGGRKKWVFERRRDDTTAKAPGNYVNIYEASLSALFGSARQPRRRLLDVTRGGGGGGGGGGVESNLFIICVVIRCFLNNQSVS